MVGEGVLAECLRDEQIQQVLVINRKPSGFQHPKLKELLVADFSDFSGVEEELKGYDAAFLSMGVSSMGLNEEEYTYLTYNLTMALARPLERLNPDMTLCYVSGQGTDSSEKGRIMWARVKGKTENDLMNMSFKQVFAFRPGGMQPEKGAKNIKRIYRFFIPLMPFFRVLFPGSMSTLRDLALAMIHVSRHGYQTQVIEVKDLKNIAKLELQKGN